MLTTPDSMTGSSIASLSSHHPVEADSSHFSDLASVEPKSFAAEWCQGNRQAVKRYQLKKKKEEEDLVARHQLAKIRLRRTTAKNFVNV